MAFVLFSVLVISSLAVCILPGLLPCVYQYTQPTYVSFHRCGEIQPVGPRAKIAHAICANHKDVSFVMETYNPMMAGWVFRPFMDLEVENSKGVRRTSVMAIEGIELKVPEDAEFPWENIELVSSSMSNKTSLAPTCDFACALRIMRSSRTKDQLLGVHMDETNSIKASYIISASGTGEIDSGHFAECVYHRCAPYAYIVSTLWFSTIVVYLGVKYVL